MSFIDLLELLGLVAPRVQDSGETIRLGLNEQTHNRETSDSADRLSNAGRNDGALLIRIGGVVVVISLFGFVVYADWLEHGFTDDPAITLALIAAGLLGLVGLLLGFVRTIVAGYAEGTRRDGS